MYVSKIVHSSLPLFYLEVHGKNVHAVCLYPFCVPNMCHVYHDKVC